MMASKFSTKDTILEWVQKLNEMLDLPFVNGSFTVTNTSFDNLDLTVTGGNIRSGTSVSNVPGVTLTLPDTETSVVGVDTVNKVLIQYILTQEPDNNFIPLFVVTTNNLRIIGVQDFRTWAYEDSGLINDHVAAADPHPQYTTDSEVDTKFQEHVAQSNPHPYYGKVFDTLDSLINDPKVQVGEYVRTLGYYESGDGGGNVYEIVEAGTGTDDGGSFIDLSGSGLQAQGKFLHGINVKQFGAVGDRINDDHQAVNNAVLFAQASTGLFSVYVPPGDYRISAPVSIDMGSVIGGPEIKLYGDASYNTRFYVDNSDGGLRFTNNPGGDMNVYLSGISVFAKSNSGSAGIGVEVSATAGAHTIPFLNVEMDDVHVYSEDQLVSQDTGGNNIPPNPGYFTRGISIVSASRIKLSNTRYKGPKQVGSFVTESDLVFGDDSVSYLSDYGIYLEDCYGPRLEFVDSENAKVGIALIGRNKASEALFWRDISGGHVKTSILIKRADDALDPPNGPGVEPGIEISGFHANFRDYGVFVEGRMQGRIASGLIYCSNMSKLVGIASPECVHIENSWNIKVENTIFVRGRDDAIGVRQVSTRPGETEPLLHVTNNSFVGTFHSAIVVDNGLGIPTVSGNQYSDGVSREVVWAGDVWSGNLSESEQSNSFLPEVIASSNASAAALGNFNYTVQGSVVRITGNINVTPETSGTVVNVDFSLPENVQDMNPSTILGQSTSVAADGTDSMIGRVTDDGSGNCRLIFLPASTLARPHVVDFIVNRHKVT